MAMSVEGQGRHRAKAPDTVSTGSTRTQVVIDQSLLHSGKPWILPFSRVLHNHELTSKLSAKLTIEDPTRGPGWACLAGAINMATSMEDVASIRRGKNDPAFSVLQWYSVSAKHTIGGLVQTLKEIGWDDAAMGLIDFCQKPEILRSLDVPIGHESVPVGWLGRPDEGRCFSDPTSQFLTQGKIDQVPEGGRVQSLPMEHDPLYDQNIGYSGLPGAHVTSSHQTGAGLAKAGFGLVGGGSQSASGYPRPGELAKSDTWSTETNAPEVMDIDETTSNVSDCNVPPDVPVPGTGVYGDPRDPYGYPFAGGMPWPRLGFRPLIDSKHSSHHHHSGIQEASDLVPEDEPRDLRIRDLEIVSSEPGRCGLPVRVKEEKKWHVSCGSCQYPTPKPIATLVTAERTRDATRGLPPALVKDERMDFSGNVVESSASSSFDSFIREIRESQTSEEILDKRFSTFPRGKTPSKVMDRPGGLTSSISAPPRVSSRDFAQGKRAIRIFLTYSNDSRRHMKKILDLYQCLTKNDFSVTLDETERDLVPREESMRVLMNRYHQAKFVLVCVSPQYYQDVTTCQQDTGSCPHSLNARYIYLLMTHELNGRSNQRIIPVLFTKSGATKQHLPPLLANLFRYRWPEQYRHLLFHLTQPEKVLEKILKKRPGDGANFPTSPSYPRPSLSPTTGIHYSS